MQDAYGAALPGQYPAMSGALPGMASGIPPYATPSGLPGQAGLWGMPGQLPGRYLDDPGLAMGALPGGLRLGAGQRCKRTQSSVPSQLVSLPWTASPH